MKKTRRCPICEAGSVRPAGPVIEMHVAGITVRDGTGIVDQCSACGETFVTADALRGYEVRAASVVLREAPDRVSGAVLRYARKALGLRQTELAALLGKNVATISDWESSTLVDATVRTSILWFLDEAQRGVDVRTHIAPKKHARGKLTLVVKAA